MGYLLVGIAVLAAVFGPALWARGVLAWHGDDRPDFPGTGGELARHLLEEFGVKGVRVEATDQGDHYDPGDKAVRLTRQNLEGRSLTAVATAAHEVGHALQDRDGYRPLETRTRLVRATHGFERVGSIILLATPFLGALTRAPGLIALELGAGLMVMSISVVIHAVTLPVEFDASFNRALPILERGGYLSEADLPAARRILRACALTYVASSLASLLNLWRWIRVLR
jgi:Zn-dependent membrane protease YugP